jgi:hypothetical protein
MFFLNYLPGSKATCTDTELLIDYPYSPGSDMWSINATLGRKTIKRQSTIERFREALGSEYRYNGTVVKVDLI